MTPEEREKAKREKLRDFFSHIRRTYGLTEADYRALYRAQGGKCYVCRRASGKAKMLGVDHDHVTGEVRGLVCTGSTSANTCNRLIARYSRDALLRAAAMLSDPPPARAVLAAIRVQHERTERGNPDSVLIPSLVEGNAPFLLSDVMPS